MSDLTDLIDNLHDLSWLDECTCIGDVDDYFVPAGHSIKPEILNSCKACPVRVEHVKHAYRCEPYGYFGGLSPRQRKTMTLEQALAFIATDPPR